MRAIALAALLLASPCFADVTVEIRNYNSSGEFTLIVAGDLRPVTLSLSSLALDWCKPGGEFGPVATPTTPDLGVPNNDTVSAASVTLTGPVTTICDIDPNTAFPGASATVGTVTKPLSMDAVTTFSSSAPPAPPTNVEYGSALLAWIPPTLYTDGTPLTNLSGFKAYWGATQGSYSSSVAIGDPAATSYAVDHLAPGTWYFVVTAVTPTAESVFSNVATKTIEGTPVPDPPPPPPPPPPPNPCVADPLLAPTSLAWPTARAGSRTLRWSSPRTIVRVDYAWPVGQNQRSTWTDDRGCTVTVAR